MLPTLSNEQIAGIESTGEQQFYGWCRNFLPASVLVLHSVSWVDRDSHGGLRDGEADFVICDEERGILCVEVKGGRVAFDPESGIWTTTDRSGIVSRLKRSPLEQAKDSKHKLLRYAQADPRWQRLFQTGSPPFAHAAFFPSLADVTGLVGINAPAEIIGCRNDAGAPLRSWVRRVFDYEVGDNPRVQLGSAGAALLEQMIFPKIDVRPILATALSEAEQRRIRLTDEQSALLDSLSRRRRAFITGGAGTGKTLLAVEKVRRLAAAGQRALLVCYNEALASNLRSALAAFPNASAFTFHSLCGQLTAEAKKSSGRDLLSEVQAEHSTWTLYDQLLPEAAARALEFVNYSFDAVVVDEAQDFRETYWLLIELLLRDGRDGTLYVFFDANQRLYGRTLHLPMDGDVPYLLSRNCRNARPIHDLAYKYYSGDPTRASTIPGRVETLNATSLPASATAISATVADLVTKQQVTAEQIAVLIAGMPKLDYIEALEKCKLPAGYAWHVAGENIQAGVRTIAVDTVQHFKGLESDIAFVWGIESAAETERPELLYVGFSRAKTILYVVGLQKSEESAQAEALEGAAP